MEAYRRIEGRVGCRHADSIGDSIRFLDAIHGVGLASKPLLALGAVSIEVHELVEEDPELVLRKGHLGRICGACHIGRIRRKGEEYGTQRDVRCASGLHSRGSLAPCLPFFHYGV